MKISLIVLLTLLLSSTNVLSQTRFSFELKLNGKKIEAKDTILVDDLTKITITVAADKNTSWGIDLKLLNPDTKDPVGQASYSGKGKPDKNNQAFKNAMSTFQANCTKNGVKSVQYNSIGFGSYKKSKNSGKLSDSKASEFVSFTFNK